MCTGKSAFQAQKNQYKRQVAQRAVDWRSQNNIWEMKNDQYDINTRENVNAYSRYVGGVQRNFGLEVQQFMKNNETLFRSQVSSSPVNEGGRSTSFGRSQKLAALYAEGAMKANLRRADIQQTEKLKAGHRQLLSAQAQELGKRGFAPIPTVEPAKPVGPSFLDQFISVASTAASFISPISSLSTAFIGLGGLGVGSNALGGFAGTGIPLQHTAGMGALASDRRLKENIIKIGEAISGLGIYKFNYLNTGKQYIGAMADEVVNIFPEAVEVMSNGFLAVKYDLIDIEFKEA